MVSIAPYATPALRTTCTLAPDPIEAEDNTDQQALMAAFMAGLARESDADFKGLSQLLATLPEPSQSRQEAMSVSEARDQGLIPASTSGSSRLDCSRGMYIFVIIMLYYSIPGI